MAFIVKFTLVPSTDQKSLILTLTSGSYSAANPGGAGAPNPALADMQACDLIVYVPDPTTYLVSTTAVGIDLFADYDFPYNQTTLQDTLTVTLPNTAFGLAATATFPDGQYQATLSMQYDAGDPEEVVVSTTIDVVLYGNVQCCLDKLVSTLTNCGCSDKKKNETEVKILKANLGFLSISYSNCNVTKSLTSLKYGAELCANSNCGGCGSGC